MLADLPAGSGPSVPDRSPRVLVLVRPGCHLCEDAKAVIAAVCAEEGVGWAERDITCDVELTRRYLGTTFEAPLRKATAVLAMSLPDKVQLNMSLLTQHYTFQPGATASADPALLDARQVDLPHVPVGPSLFRRRLAEHDRP